VYIVQRLFLHERDAHIPARICAKSWPLPRYKEASMSSLQSRVCGQSSWRFQLQKSQQLSAVLLAFLLLGSLCAHIKVRSQKKRSFPHPIFTNEFLLIFGAFLLRLGVVSLYTHCVWLLVGLSTHTPVAVWNIRRLLCIIPPPSVCETNADAGPGSLFPGAPPHTHTQKRCDDMGD
jgi:hypothetical protein